MKFKLFNDLILLESEKSAQKEITHITNVINLCYNEWKKIGRRKNAVDLITTTANKISNIHPSSVNKLHDATKVKIIALILRCLDIPYWKEVSSLERIYKKLIDIISILETESSSTDSGGSLREAIMTRLSASICYNSDNKNIFVAYEPTISKDYLKFLYGSEKPEKTYKMSSLALPSSFETLINILRTNHEKAVEKFNNSKQD